jgi:hypothetical protein
MRIFAAVLGLAVILAPGAAGAAGGPLKVAVVDFYALTPLTTFSGVFPERFLADDLAAQLAREAGDRLEVIPRDAVQRSEREMQWNEADVLRFDRLRALAGALGADRLVVGWIPLLSVDEGSGGGGGRTSDGGGGPGVTRVDISLVIQVFDASQGRIVDEARYEHEDAGGLRSQLALRAMHNVLRPAIPALLDRLTVRT